jgi:CheY-like chemotaxis protein
MPLRVLVYSDDKTVRHKVIQGIGTRPDSSIPPLEFIEVATGPAVLERLGAGGVGAAGAGIDLAILDGEAAPFGGMGVAKQIKDEVAAPPPIVVLIGRAQDSWLANWSRAEAVVSHPIDPMRLSATVIELLRAEPSTPR